MPILKVYDGSGWVEVPILDGVPGGELGGTWASPTVDGTHSGSAHHAQAHTAASHSDQGATGAELETLTDTSDADALHAHTNHGVTHNAAHGPAKHTEGGNWKMPYTDGSGDEQELALGADDTILESTGASSAPVMRAHEHSMGITAENPSSSEDLTIKRIDAAITVKEIHAVLRGSDTPSVTWTIRHQPAGTGSGRGATGNEVVTGGTTTTSITAGDDVASFNDATIPADSFVWLETTAKSGTVNEIHITIRSTFD